MLFFRMKIGSALLSLLLLNLVGCGCAKTETTNGMLVLNILDPDLYQDCHIAGSLNVPLEQLESYVQNLDRKREIVVYCSNYRCTASSYAAQLLMKLGFFRAYAYEAGMTEWYQHKLPVKGACQEKYLTMKIKAEDVDHNPQIKTITTTALAQKLGLSK